MEQLPPDLMVRVLEFVDLPERLQLSMCSTTILKFITEDCAPLWFEIVFCSLQHAASLTDEMLAALLKRVDARNVTKYVDLDGCSEIRGTGLAPLRHSPVLERLDLRTGAGDTEDDNMYHLDETAVVDTLRTMLPYELCDVIFYPVSDDVSDPRLIARKFFFREIRSAMHQRAIQQDTRCSSCCHPVCDESRQLVPNELGLPSTRCYSCQNYFCWTNTCPVGLRQCRDCEDAFCETCDAVEQCVVCACYFCEDCREVSPACCICHGTFCEDCRKVYTCESCNETTCEECIEDADDEVDDENDDDGDEGEDDDDDEDYGDDDDEVDYDANESEDDGNGDYKDNHLFVTIELEQPAYRECLV